VVAVNRRRLISFRSLGMGVLLDPVRAFYLRRGGLRSARQGAAGCATGPSRSGMSAST
jgi:hypothetical protein